METNKIIKGNRVKVVNNWMDEDGKKAMAVVEKIQRNGNIEFAQIRWVGKAANPDFIYKY